MPKFTASCVSMEEYNGEVEIVRSLTPNEADLDETGPMFKCRAKDGRLFDAFEDELVL